MTGEVRDLSPGGRLTQGPQAPAVALPARRATSRATSRRVEEVAREEVVEEVVWWPGIPALGGRGGLAWPRTPGGETRPGAATLPPAPGHSYTG